MHLGCVTTNYKYPLKVSSKMYHYSQKYNLLAKNGLISRLAPDGKVYAALML